MTRQTMTSLCTSYCGSTTLVGVEGEQLLQSTRCIHKLYVIYNKWVILLNLVHTGYLQFLAIFHNLAGNEHGFFDQN